MAMDAPAWWTPERELQARGSVMAPERSTAQAILELLIGATPSDRMAGIGGFGEVQAMDPTAAALAAQARRLLPARMWDWLMKSPLKTKVRTTPQEFTKEGFSAAFRPFGTEIELARSGQDVTTMAHEFTHDALFKAGEYGRRPPGLSFSNPQAAQQIYDPGYNMNRELLPYYVGGQVGVEPPLTRAEQLAFLEWFERIMPSERSKLLGLQRQRSAMRGTVPR